MSGESIRKAYMRQTCDVCEAPFTCFCPCEERYYCGRVCQREDWGAHKKTCASTKKKRVERKKKLEEANARIANDKILEEISNSDTGTAQARTQIRVSPQIQPSAIPPTPSPTSRQSNPTSSAKIPVKEHAQKTQSASRPQTRAQAQGQAKEVGQTTARTQTPTVVKPPTQGNAAAQSQGRSTTHARAEPRAQTQKQPQPQRVPQSGPQTTVRTPAAAIVKPTTQASTLSQQPQSVPPNISGRTTVRPPTDVPDPAQSQGKPATHTPSQPQPQKHPQTAQSMENAQSQAPSATHARTAASTPAGLGIHSGTPTPIPTSKQQQSSVQARKGPTDPQPTVSANKDARNPSNANSPAEVTAILQCGATAKPQSATVAMVRTAPLDDALTSTAVGVLKVGPSLNDGVTAHVVPPALEKTQDITTAKTVPAANVGETMVGTGVSKLTAARISVTTLSTHTSAPAGNLTKAGTKPISVAGIPTATWSQPRVATEGISATASANMASNTYAGETTVTPSLSQPATATATVNKPATGTVTMTTTSVGRPATELLSTPVAAVSIIPTTAPTGKPSTAGRISPKTAGIPSVGMSRKVDTELSTIPPAAGKNDSETPTAAEIIAQHADRQPPPALKQISVEKHVPSDAQAKTSMIPEVKTSLSLKRPIKDQDKTVGQSATEGVTGVEPAGMLEQVPPRPQLVPIPIKAGVKSSMSAGAGAVSSTGAGLSMAQDSVPKNTATPGAASGVQPSSATAFYARLVPIPTATIPTVTKGTSAADGASPATNNGRPELKAAADSIGGVVPQVNTAAQLTKQAGGKDSDMVKNKETDKDADREHKSTEDSNLPSKLGKPALEGATAVPLHTVKPTLQSTSTVLSQSTKPVLQDTIAGLKQTTDSTHPDVASLSPTVKAPLQGTPSTSMQTVDSKRSSGLSTQTANPALHGMMGSTPQSVPVPHSSTGSTQQASMTKPLQSMPHPPSKTVHQSDTSVPIQPPSDPRIRQPPSDPRIRPSQLAGGIVRQTLTSGTTGSAVARYNTLQNSTPASSIHASNIGAAVPLAKVPTSSTAIPLSDRSVKAVSPANVRDSSSPAPDASMTSNAAPVTIAAPADPRQGASLPANAATTAIAPPADPRQAPADPRQGAQATKDRDGDLSLPKDWSLSGPPLPNALPLTRPVVRKPVSLTGPSPRKAVVIEGCSTVKDVSVTSVVLPPLPRAKPLVKKAALRVGSQTGPIDPRNGPQDPRKALPDSRNGPQDPRRTSLDPRNTPQGPRNGPNDPRNVHQDPTKAPQDLKIGPKDPRNGLQDPRIGPHDPRLGPQDPRKASHDPNPQKPQPPALAPTLAQTRPQSTRPILVSSDSPTTTPHTPATPTGSTAEHPNVTASPAHVAGKTPASTGSPVPGAETQTTQTHTKIHTQATAPLSAKASLPVDGVSSTGALALVMGGDGVDKNRADKPVDAAAVKITPVTDTTTSASPLVAVNKAMHSDTMKGSVSDARVGAPVGPSAAPAVPADSSGQSHSPSVATVVARTPSSSQLQIDTHTNSLDPTTTQANAGTTTPAPQPQQQQQQQPQPQPHMRARRRNRAPPRMVSIAGLENTITARAASPTASSTVPAIPIVTGTTAGNDMPTTVSATADRATTTTTITGTTTGNDMPTTMSATADHATTTTTITGTDASGASATAAKDTTAPLVGSTTATSAIAGLGPNNSTATMLGTTASVAIAPVSAIRVRDAATTGEGAIGTTATIPTSSATTSSTTGVETVTGDSANTDTTTTPATTAHSAQGASARLDLGAGTSTAEEKVPDTQTHTSTVTGNGMHASARVLDMPTISGNATRKRRFSVVDSASKDQAHTKTIPTAHAATDSTGHQATADVTQAEEVGKAAVDTDPVDDAAVFKDIISGTMESAEDSESDAPPVCVPLSPSMTSAKKIPPSTEEEIKAARARIFGDSVNRYLRKSSVQASTAAKQENKGYIVIKAGSIEPSPLIEMARDKRRRREGAMTDNQSNSTPTTSTPNKAPDNVVVSVEKQNNEVFVPSDYQPMSSYKFFDLDRMFIPLNEASRIAQLELARCDGIVAETMKSMEILRRQSLPYGGSAELVETFKAQKQVVLRYQGEMGFGKKVLQFVTDKYAMFKDYKATMVKNVLGEDTDNNTIVAADATETTLDVCDLNSQVAQLMADKLYYEQQAKKATEEANKIKEKAEQDGREIAELKKKLSDTTEERLQKDQLLAQKDSTISQLTMYQRALDESKQIAEQDVTHLTEVNKRLKKQLKEQFDAFRPQMDPTTGTITSTSTHSPSLRIHSNGSGPGSTRTNARPISSPRSHSSLSGSAFKPDILSPVIGFNRTGGAAEAVGTATQASAQNSASGWQTTATAQFGGTHSSLKRTLSQNSTGTTQSQSTTAQLLTQQIEQQTRQQIMQQQQLLLLQQHQRSQQQNNLYRQQMQFQANQMMYTPLATQMTYVAQQQPHQQVPQQSSNQNATSQLGSISNGMQSTQRYSPMATADTSSAAKRTGSFTNDPVLVKDDLYYAILQRDQDKKILNMNTTILDEPTRRKQFLMFFTSMAKKMGFPAEMTEEQRQMAANGAREMLSSRANAFKAGRPVSDYFL